jgi:hypothetical protein
MSKRNLVAAVIGRLQPSLTAVPEMETMSMPPMIILAAARWTPISELGGLYIGTVK